MSDKILLAFVALFVLAAGAGIFFLFFSSGDEKGFDNEPLQAADGGEGGPEKQVISDVSEQSPDGEVKPLEAKTEKIETVQPQTPCGEIQGRVLDAMNRPIADAEVSLYKAVPAVPLVKRKPTHLKSSTDANGQYHLPSVPEGSQYSILVSAEQYASAEMDGLSVIADETSQVADIRLDQGFMLSGTVTTADAMPLSDVEITAVDKMKQMAEMPEEVYTRATRTDGNGKFTLPSLTQTQYEITFYSEGYRPLTVTQNFILTGKEEGPRLLDVQLDESGLVLVGTVKSPQGRGIPEAEVQALFHSPKRNAHFTAKAKTNQNGFFRLAGLSEGRYSLLASAKGYFQSESRSAEAGDEGFEIPMLPTGAVEGIIQASKNPPKTYEVHIDKYVASVRVTGQNRKAHLSGGSKPEFKYTDLLPGKYVFLVKAPGYAQTRSEEVEVKSGETTTGVVVSLVEGGYIKGKLVDNRGEPLLGVKVKLMDKTYDPSLPFEELFLVPPEQEKTTASGSKGAFMLRNVRPGTYVLKIEGDTVARKVIKNVTVVEGGTQDLGRIKLTKGGRIRGVAYNEEGKPAQGSKVTAYSSDTGNRKTATTDNQGGFLLNALAPGEYIVSLTPKDFWSALKYQASVTVFVDENRTTQVDIYTVPAERNRTKDFIPEER
ncbi:MAG: carboxypeptidase regulatory-like domain-containing protein [Planctomycetota bacterium]|jgi:hypothetical protein